MKCEGDFGMIPVSLLSERYFDHEMSYLQKAIDPKGDFPGNFSFSLDILMN